MASGIFFREEHSYRYNLNCAMPSRKKMILRSIFYHERRNN